MAIPELQQHLNDRSNVFLSVAAPLSNEQFFAPLDGDKWSVAENLQHLFLSARPVARVLAGPREFLAQFGKPSQPSRSYEQLLADYKRTLRETGIKAPASMVGRAEDLTDRSAVTDRFSQAHQGVATALINWTDDELDAYYIPHPALGLLTIREMVYFTILHVDHHLDLTRERLTVQEKIEILRT